jgi:hypothetical protein
MPRYRDEFGKGRSFAVGKSHAQAFHETQPEILGVIVLSPVSALRAATATEAWDPV